MLGGIEMRLSGTGHYFLTLLKMPTQTNKQRLSNDMEESSFCLTTSYDVSLFLL
jgi:hypothetical protein